MNVLVVDRLSGTASAALRAAGHTVLENVGVKDAALVTAVRQAEPNVLVVRSTKVSANVMDASPRLELIVRAGAGVDNIDVGAASERGIFVSNCPGRNAAAVAELTLGLILALDRSIADNVVDARAGVWNKGKYSKAPGLKGRTLGIVGLGHIGREVAARARAFDMRILAWSRSLTDEAAHEMGVERREDPLDVARQADVVTLHLAAAPETDRIAGRRFFDAMKPDAYFVNTSRASLVDEEALLWALDKKGIRAALDVFEGEPAGKDGAFESPLARHSGVYLTHHVGASTEEAQEAVAVETARVINTYAETGHVPNWVNMAVRSPATHVLTLRMLDKVGALAPVLNEVRRAGWNVQEMETLIFEGATAAVTRIRFDGQANHAVVSRIAAHPDVLAVTLLPL